MDVSEGAQFKDTAVPMSILPDKVLEMNSAYFRDMQNAPQDRSIVATITYSCDACLDGGPWSGSWNADPSFGEFTVYGFDDQSVVNVTAQSCTNAGACSEVVGPVTAVAGANDGVQDCVEGGGDPCDGQAAGDANGDGTVNVLDVVSIVNHI